MSPRSRIFTAAALLLLAGGIWLLTRRAPEAPAALSNPAPPPVVKTASLPTPPGPPEFGSAAFAQAAMERGAPWLEEGKEP